VTTHSQGLDRAWVVSFLRHLPAELRTSPDDPKLVAAAAQARANGWDAVVLATAVAARDYGGTTLHPSLMAIQRLHELGSIPPPPAPPERRDWGADREAHCGRQGCGCTHDNGCFKGWVDHLPGAHGAYDFVEPCRNCRPVLHQRIRDIPPPGERTPGDLASIRAERGRG
jgi:hypothetical protein